MGYTHYWRRQSEITPEKWALIVRDCKRLCDSIPIPLGDGAGEGDPVFDDKAIVFNGSVNSQSFSRDGGGLNWPAAKAEGAATVGNNTECGSWFAGKMLSSRAVDDNGDGSYETFAIERVRPRYENDAPRQMFFFDCCKTNYRPYDLLVQGCLIVCKEHLGEAFIVSSDGEQSQWNEAADGCQVFLGYGLTFELDTAEARDKADKARIPVPVPSPGELAEIAAKRAATVAGILAKRPPWATAVIVAELQCNESDSQSDYFAHSTKRVVAIGWRKGKRENFKALRKAAAGFSETVHLGPDCNEYTVRAVFTNDVTSNGSAYWKGSYSHWHGEPEEFKTLVEAEACVAAKGGPPHDISFDGTIGHFEWNIRCEDVEHRECWSMGGGNYLKAGGRHNSGWCVRSHELHYSLEGMEDGIPGEPPAVGKTRKAKPAEAHKPIVEAAGDTVEIDPFAEYAFI